MFFKKKKKVMKEISRYDKLQEEKKAELKATLQVLYHEFHKDDDYNSSSDFSISDFLMRKIEAFLNKNLRAYFNANHYGSNAKLDKLLSDTLDMKLKEWMAKYFWPETEEKIVEHIANLSTYHITKTQAFEKFMADYLEKNKWDLHYQIRKIADNEKFIDRLSEEIWWEIGQIIRDKVETCGC